VSEHVVRTDAGIYRVDVANPGQAAAVIRHQKPQERIRWVASPWEFVGPDGVVLARVTADLPLVEWVR
jgi:hypothetical protein